MIGQVRLCKEKIYFTFSELKKYGSNAKRQIELTQFQTFKQHTYDEKHMTHIALRVTENT